MELPYLQIDLPIWVILSTLLILLIYLYGIWPYRFFSSRGIPGPKPIPFIGNFVDFFTKTEIENERKWVKQYGKIFGFYNGRTPVLSIHDPNLIEDVLIRDFSKYCNRENDVPLNKPMEHALIFMEGNEWRLTRNAILPTFTSGKLKQYFKAITECGDRLEGLLEKKSSNGNTDSKKLFGNYALEVIAATGFGLEVDAQNNLHSPFLLAVSKMFEKAIPVSYLIYKILPFLKPVTNLMGLTLWPDESIEFFRKTTKMIMNDKKVNGQKTKDFVQLLLDCRKSDSENDEKLIELTEDEIISQVILLFLAGYETTASLMTFTSYNLSQNPDIQEKVFAEIKEHIGDGEMTYENIGKLTYLTQCLYETLRLFPPVYSMSRVAQEDVMLGGYQVPRGTVINIPYQYVHLDPEVYPDPLTFNPDRFSPEKRTEKKATFLAFGAGPRMCIGNRLALLEAKLAIVFVLRKHFLSQPNNQDEIKFLPGPLLGTTEKIDLQFNPRHSKSKKYE